MARSNITDIDFEEVAHETLIDCHGALQKKRRVGYFASQGLRQLMDHVDPGCVMQLVGKRRAAEQSVTGTPISRTTAEYLQRDVNQTETVRLEYDRKKHRPFNWQATDRDLREYESVYDVALTHVVVKTTDSRITEFLSEFIEESMDRIDRNISTSWVKPPCYITLKPNSAPVGSDRREHISNYTPDHYFRPREESDGPVPGLNWTHFQSLDLVSVESKLGFLEKPDVIFEEDTGYNQIDKYTPTDIEDELINTYSTDEPRFGAINSEVLIEKVKQAFFDHDSFGMSDYDWDTSQGWSESG